ncbi:DUF5060 domain-containing protein [Catenovulum adriaticum]|uniref:DUF5060 domain-containing protein n=1 Tax=Catenovulum adriaticum TaxID=2984846 RepID=A0ABY7AN75_9ALTE|nr:DUF5060 domain-containing protein [Catenovulum sp. TS8]WAJ70596.1 DUF5060 domain-containing protein [Catenovulum sp. TS8]
MKKIVTLLPIFALASCASYQSGIAVKSLESPAFQQANSDQYAPIIIDSQVVAEWQNPYDSQDVAVDLAITTPSGTTKKLPGYFVEGSSLTKATWRFKFTPTEIGQYQVSTHLTDDGQQVQSEKKTFNVKETNLQGFLRANDQWTFKYDNGDLFRGIGENFGWESRDEDDSRYFKALHEDSRFNYDHMLKTLNHQGANLIRTWMIYWNLPVDYQTVNNNSRYQNSSKRFNPSGVARMDHLLDLASQYDMKIILSMDSHAGFTGDGWAFNSYNQANGGPAESATDFFTNPIAKQRYKDKLRFLVAKWSYSPQIAAWEFFNEIDNVMYHGEEQQISDEIITSWHREMSDYLAQIDVHDHLVTTSISHRGVAGLFDLPNIDINQSHLYKITDRIPEVINKYTQAHNKPYFAGEFSAEWDWSKNFNDYKLLMVNDFKRGLWYGLFSPTPIAPLTWWWEYFDENNTTPYFNHVKTINQKMLKTSTGTLSQIQLNNSNSHLTTYAVNNGNQIFVYVNNPTNAEQTFELTGHSALSNLNAIYHCETGKFISTNAGYNLLSANSDHVLIFNL